MKVFADSLPQTKVHKLARNGDFMHMFPAELHTFHHVSKTVLHFALCEHDSSIEMAREFYTYILC